MKGIAKFAGKVAIAHSVTYIVCGALAYFLLTKPLYMEGASLLSRFMRTEADPVLWSHVNAWLLPGQLLRGLLMAAALFPFLPTLAEWDFRRRFLAITGLYVVFGFWGASVAGVGNVEGLIYLRPEFTWAMHLRVQPEILFQGAAFGAWVARWIRRPA